MKSMSRSIGGIALVLALPARAGVTLEVYPSPAPNIFGSPSWTGYVSNALNSLRNGLGNIGNRNTDPTAYEIAGASIDPGDILVTSYPSWRGRADPATYWGPAFAGELGNRLHFGLHALGDGQTRFTLEDLRFEVTSTDVQPGFPGGVLYFAGDFVGYTYGPTRFGVDWGPDRVRGTTDDIVYNSGNGTTLVDEIVYVGVGSAYWPGGGDPDPTQPVLGRQGAIDDSIAYIASWYPLRVTGRYWILGSEGSATVTVMPAPGPVAILGLVGLAAMRRRRR